MMGHNLPNCLGLVLNLSNFKYENKIVQLYRNLRIVGKCRKEY